MRAVDEARKHDQLVEELRLLLDALAGKAEEHLRGCAPRAEDEERGCGWCPLCAAVALVRGQRPELNDQLLGIVQLLRQAMAEPEPQPAEEPEPDAPAKVQRIRVQRVGGTVLDEC
ncbi:hypothetical protein SAMN05421805_12238 [Saccharopolyspora antimicrobica]|uniref:Uncharacterized protein n=1 Tax=Saccharopolyspora antimicrobica TaxID=455193 RepID=A0A1I5JCQ8_9PSEU|nr:hypothetical protein [Saccharopolyspora antimicrobica]RKT82465.1 hypothetical protein ATL45_0713 [Saccharopolyspora antimicrobica]SFO70420.1 hypothetical protein SAMN05421805_12238 [Saccharopolyspora antimicrobica]